MISLYKKELEDIKKYCQIKSLQQTANYEKKILMNAEENTQTTYLELKVN